MKAMTRFVLGKEAISSCCSTPTRFCIPQPFRTIGYRACGCRRTGIPIGTRELSFEGGERIDQLARLKNAIPLSGLHWRENARRNEDRYGAIHRCKCSAEAFRRAANREHGHLWKTPQKSECRRV
jgi:hypothetical protein